jgi:hypothetical protein
MKTFDEVLALLGLTEDDLEPENLAECKATGRLRVSRGRTYEGTHA